MANRSRKKKGGGGALTGAKGPVAAVIAVIGLAASVMGWWNYNGFENVNDALGWFQEKSDNIMNCQNERLEGNENAKGIINAGTCIIPDITGDGSSNKGGSNANSDSKGSSNSGGTGATTESSKILAQLDKVEIAAPEKVNYNRSEWKHWSDLDKNGCDTREDKLVQSGKNVKTGEGCKVLSGSWVESYAGKSYSDSSKMDLDHVVPLSYAAKQGAQAWDKNKKEKFANDIANLVLADASENRAKGDKGPSEYLPPNKDYQCSYVSSFTNVIVNYGLTMPRADVNAIRKVVETRC